MNDRIPCINPRCRRTAPAEKYDEGTEIVCGKCFRALPLALRVHRRALERRDRRLLRLVERRVARGTITPVQVERVRLFSANRLHANWAAIKRCFTAPERPVGLEGFLQEIGL
jgi:hypothetical protein